MAAALQPPELLFRTAEYSAWDGRGMPTHDAAGEEVSKNAKKKLEKRMKVATAKYLKAAAAPAPTGKAPTGEAGEEEEAGSRRRVHSGLPCPPCRAGTAPPGRETVRAPHGGSKPGLAPGGGAAATGPSGAQIARAALE